MQTQQDTVQDTVPKNARQVARGTGQAPVRRRLGKVRRPPLTWVLALLVPLYLPWWVYRVNREARDYDPEIEVEPVASAFGVLLGAPFVVPYLFTLHNAGKRIRYAQAEAGLRRQVSPGLGALLAVAPGPVLGALLYAAGGPWPLVLPLCGWFVPYYQGELNRVWARHGRH
jgi:hypothetical protein